MKLLTNKLIDIKILILLMISIFSSAFCPFKEAPVKQSRPGFYVFVDNYWNGDRNKFIVESKDSLNKIFNSFFNMELELGEVQRPISIYNGKLDFYVARVNVFENPKGKKKIKHLKYPKVTKHSKLQPDALNHAKAE